MTNSRIRLRHYRLSIFLLVSAFLLSFFTGGIRANNFPVGHPHHPGHPGQHHHQHHPHNGDASHFPDSCSPPKPTVQRISYDELEKRFDELDEFTRRSHRKYWDRLWGIASISLYNRTKTSFMYRVLSELPLDPPPVVCELGMMAGHSATVFLESLPTARVYTFDLADFAWSYPNSKHLRELYGERFTYIPGDSMVTIPEFAKAHPDEKCSVLLIDGSKEGPHRRKDMLMFKEISKPHALLFLDEVNSEECVRGLVAKTDPKCTFSFSNVDLAFLYQDLVREGQMTIGECIKTPTPGDEYCSAYFVP